MNSDEGSLSNSYSVKTEKREFTYNSPEANNFIYPPYGPPSNENIPNSSSVNVENINLVDESLAVDLSVDHLKDTEDLWRVYLTRYYIFPPT